MYVRTVRTIKLTFDLFVRDCCVRTVCTFLRWISIMTSLSARINTGSRCIPDASGVKQWSLTFAATAISTYALDAVASVMGVLLVASELLGSLDHVLVLLFLASTYVVWGGALRVNLKANWCLLEGTGTSTNVLSKAAYNLAKLRTRSVRKRRIAAGIGYVIIELAKEWPYYAGAFGVAILSNSVSSNEVLIFLGGANLGAAGYEYGLAWVTRAFLHRKNTPRYASFERDWVPKEYLANYYTTVDADERHTIAFFVDAIKGSQPDKPILFFGVGPTMHHVFPVACKVSEIHLGDYLPANLREIERWIERDADAHDWRPFTRYTLECEGLAAPTENEIVQREEVTRAKITKLMEIDIQSADPLGEPNGLRYETVISAYCADSVTGDRAMWETYMRRIVELVCPGGTLITAALRGTQSYLIGGKTFPSPNIDEEDFRKVLAPYFEHENLMITVCEVPECASQGYSSIVLARAHRRRASAYRPPGRDSGELSRRYWRQRSFPTQSRNPLSG